MGFPRIPFLRSFSGPLFLLNWVFKLLALKTWIKCNKTGNNNNENGPRSRDLSCKTANHETNDTRPQIFKFNFQIQF